MSTRRRTSSKSAKEAKADTPLDTQDMQAASPAHQAGNVINTPLLNLPCAASALIQPRVLTSPAPWAGHIPFAAWLIAATRPRTFVELGVYSGISYLAFCQAAAEQGMPLRAWGVDTWEGDAHAGHYGADILHTLRAQHDALYGSFSTLLQKTFDAALADIPDASVDLLHIDGLHTYEAVRHDFESWRGKLSERAVVLFHDTAVREGDFGVWCLWDEVRTRWPALEFEHSNGLGVLLVGEAPPEVLLALTQDAARWQRARAAFAALGRRLELQAALQHTSTLLADEQARSAERLEHIGQQDEQLRAAERLHAVIEQQKAHIAQQDEQLRELERIRPIIEQQKTHIELQDEQLRRAADELSAEQARSTERLAWIETLDAQLLALGNAPAVIARQSAHITQLDRHIIAQQMHIDALLASHSWRYAAWLRWLGRQARRARDSRHGQRALHLARRARNAASYALRGDWAGLAARVREIHRQRSEERNLQRLIAAAASGSALPCGILATPHTRYVAHALQAALQRAGLHASLMDAPPTDGRWPLPLYFIICPQMFSSLPPGEKRIAFQMEQTVSSRWFTPRYVHTLTHSLAMLDYTPANLPALAALGIRYPHLFLAPIGGIANYPAQLGYDGGMLPAADEQCEVLFYGDASAPRRQRLLEAVGKRFKLRVVREVFGESLHRALAGACVVLNIHYYEGALLETTRVYECLSLGVPVVSETAADQPGHAALDGIVHFASCDNEAALLEAIDAALRQHSNATAHSAWQERLRAHLTVTQQHFDWSIQRLLLARRIHDWQRFELLTDGAPPLAARIALSLPETHQRRAAFEAMRLPDVQLFDGLRYTPGWVGAALSYKYLAHRAVQQSMEQLEVMEDDVLFPPDFDARRQRVLDWLAAHEGQWDLFLGTMAIVHPETRVLHVDKAGGETFITIDRPMSMVCNIYAPAALQRIAAWDEKNQDADTNTIDRWLQSAGLRAVLTLPFLAGHREDQDSSLWGISNASYAHMIADAEKRLGELAEAWLSKQQQSGAHGDA